MPQSLYLYGTYKEDGTPDYGLFCWATYCWDEGLRFVACIGEDKLTRDRIRETGVFSASIVSEALLPAADFCGNNPGYTCDKAGVIRSEKGAVLEVPVPESSPWTFELEVDKTLHLDDTRTSEIYICRIRNLRADERLAGEAGSLEERLRWRPRWSACPPHISRSEGRRSAGGAIGNSAPERGLPRRTGRHRVPTATGRPGSGPGCSMSGA